VEQFGGKLVDVKVLTDREIGRGRGCGFIEWATEDQAQHAMCGQQNPRRWPYSSSRG